ncbi:MAG: ATP-binding protein [Burkholderiales bacterium]
MNQPSIQAEWRERSVRSEQSPEDLRALSGRFFEAIADAVLVIDQNGQIIRQNRQTGKMFGYDSEELLNQPLDKLIPERLRGAHAGHLRKYLGNPAARPMNSGFIALGLRKDGTEFAIDAALTPLVMKSGVFVACTIRDIASRQSLEEELRRRISGLEQEDRNKDLFLMTLIHELRSPVTAIAYSAELLRQPDLPPNVRTEAAKIVLDEARLVQCLLNDLRELPRVKRGELNITRKTVDLVEAARLAVAINQPLIERCGHTLEVVLPAAPLYAQADATRMVQVMTNLLTNAAKYTPDGGHIRLCIESDGDDLVIRVQDNGIGIPEDSLTRVFEMFSRLDGAKQKYADGLGIGLPIVRRLMEAQGGSVKAFSAGVGKGSEFVARLPRAQPPHADTAAPAAADRHEALRGPEVAGIPAIAPECQVPGVQLEG